MVGGADIKSECTSGISALHSAAFYDSVGQITKLLLDYNSNINAKDKKGKTPLHVAAEVRDFLYYNNDTTNKNDDTKLAIYFSQILIVIQIGIKIYFAMWFVPKKRYIAGPYLYAEHHAKLR